MIYQSLREIEPESGSDTLCGAGDASSSQHECFNMDESHSHEKNLWLTEVTMQRKKKGGKKPSGRISAEKAEKMTVSQEKMEDSRSHMTSKEYKLQKDQHFTKNSETLQANIMEPGCENTDGLCPAKFLETKEQMK
ncbi:MORN repeat-containing protein 1 isoform X4 [Haliaeetus albicilla]|uniref:MORN repeat-containing protein 1 isoform X4 n=1 Tax=Haliaeetus albicilla TaxID=8969 RepID=UPI0037E7311E